MPGEDKMLWFHLRYDGEDTAFSYAGMLSRASLVITSCCLRARNQSLRGRWKTGSKPEDMAKFDLSPFPALNFRQDMYFYPERESGCLCNHIILIAETAILICDIIRLRRMEIKDVTTWVAPFAAKQL